MFDLSFNGRILKISPINGVLDGKLSMEFCIGTSSIELVFFQRMFDTGSCYEGWLWC